MVEDHLYVQLSPIALIAYVLIENQCTELEDVTDRFPSRTSRHRQQSGES